MKRTRSANEAEDYEVFIPKAISFIMKFSFPKLYPSKETADGEFNKLKKFVSALFKEYDQASMENARNQVPGVGSTSHIDDSDETCSKEFEAYDQTVEYDTDDTDEDNGDN
ncbi:hypothetical protein Tco_1433778 [Tanacetum coccineum]